MKTEKVDVESVRVVDPERPMLPAGRERVVQRTVTPPVRKRGWGWIVALVLVAGAAVGAYFLYPYVVTMFSGAAKARPQRPSAPVVVAKARKGDMALYLDQIGTVAPLNMVTVHTRVDGQLVKVAFTEGQVVKAGDLLAQIDPRPFEVQLEQAKGALAHDQALLDNAKVDLKRYEDAAEAVAQQLVATAAATVRQYEGNIATDEGQIDSANVNLAYCEVRSPINGRAGLRLVDEGNIVHASDANGLVVITQEQPITVLFSVPQDSLPLVLKKLYAGEALNVDAFDRTLTTKLGSGTVLATDSEIDQTTATLKFKAVFPNATEMLFPSQAVNARLYTETLHDVVIVPAAAVQVSPTSTFVYVIKKESAASQPTTQEGAAEEGAKPAAEGEDAAGSGTNSGSGANGGASKGAGRRGGGGQGSRGPMATVEMRTVTTGPQEGDDMVIASGIEAGEVVVTEGVDKLQDGAKVTIGKSDAATQPGAETMAGAAAASQGAHGAGATTRRKRRTQ